MTNDNYTDSLKKMGPGIDIKRLYPIADTLGMTLNLDGLPAVRVRGSVSRDILVEAFDLQIPVKAKITSSIVDMTGEDVGLLLHVVGHLYLFMFHTELNAKFTAFLIDGSKLAKEHLPTSNMFERENVRSYSGAMKRLGNAVVATFQRGQEEHSWTKVEGSLATTVVPA